MKLSHFALSGFALLCLASASLSQPETSGPAPTRPAQQTTIPWNRQTVEHLFNRAGFGARAAEISRALKHSPEEVVEKLLNGGRQVAPPHYTQGTLAELQADAALPKTQKRRARALRQRADREQLQAYAAWWIDRMVHHDDPLRDRMTLFWHGLFATSYSKVKRSYDMIEQHRMLRQNALGNYGHLLHGIVRDPAMLFFLDNQKNKNSAPNENLGRELLELFSLGEGNYTEQDVKEVARALTGESRDKLGNYQFLRNRHDRERKTVLGESGRFRATDVVEILLRQTACSRYISGRILTYLEGLEPDDLRLAEYSAYLKRHEYNLKPFLRKLLLDPRFYREEVIAARVAGPLEYLVGSVRRLSLELDSQFILVAANELGQRLFDPPSVKGWDGGEAWITTGSLLARGNTVGMMLGAIDYQASFRPLRKQRDRLTEPPPTGSGAGEENQAPADEAEGMAETMESTEMSSGDEATNGQDEMPKELAVLLRTLGRGYRPSLNLTYSMKRMKKAGDERIVDLLLRDLLAIKPPGETRERVLGYFRGERQAAGIAESDFLAKAEISEPILRRTAHLILSLPEAQLN